MLTVYGDNNTGFFLDKCEARRRQPCLTFDAGVAEARPMACLNIHLHARPSNEDKVPETGKVSEVQRWQRHNLRKP